MTYLTSTALRTQLGITQPALTRLIHEGLPYVAKGRTKMFDARAVTKWLLDTGRATLEGQPDPAKIARTRRECADYFGVSTRCVSKWLEDPTFPGRSGTRGMRDGHFPLPAIIDWMQARDATGPRSELLKARIRRMDVQNAIAQHKLAERKSSLAPRDELVQAVRALMRQAVPILDQLMCDLLADAPADLSAADRRSLRSVLRGRITEAKKILGEAVAGDGDDPQ